MSPQQRRIQFRNARIVLPEGIRTGSVVIEDGKIVDVDSGNDVQADESSIARACT